MRSLLLFLGVLALKSYGLGDVLPEWAMGTPLLRNDLEGLEPVHSNAQSWVKRPRQQPEVYLAQVVESGAATRTDQSPSGKKPIKALLAPDATGEPVTIFPPETPTLYLRWQGEILNQGDKVRCVWIAEDVGEAAPPNYEVKETTTTASEVPAYGTFTLSRPTKGWPLGKYRVELYVGDTLAETLKFMIEKAGP